METEETTLSMTESMHLPKVGGVKNKPHTLMLILGAARRWCVLYTWDPNRCPWAPESSPHPIRYTDTPQPLAKASNKYA